MQPGRIAVIAAALCGLICAAPARAATVEIAIENLVFKPAAAQAKVGDTIRWTNKDFLEHTATATGGAFDVKLPAGKSGSVVVTKAGTFDYFCKLHPNMKGEITVTP
jgi:plastocyanin